VFESRIELVHYLQLHYSTQFNVVPEYQLDIKKHNYMPCIVHVYPTSMYPKASCNKFVAMKVIVNLSVRCDVQPC